MAVQDLNKPNISLFNSDVYRMHSYVLSAISNIAITHNFYIQPELRYLKNSHMETYIIGGNIVYRHTPDILHIKLGAGVLKNDRYNISIGTEIQKVSAKFSYGWQVDDFIHKNAEFSLSYQMN